MGRHCASFVEDTLERFHLPSGAVVRPPTPMLAKLESALPVGPAWRYEPKLDGFRGLLSRTNDEHVRLLSRNGRDLAPWFPELIRAATSLRPGP
jgi:ATP-dependent DNA ligase